MRLPTPSAALYDWHTRALAGLQPVITQEPQCGWYKRKLVKGGVFVPARIWMVQEIDADTGELLSDELFQCEVNGAYADPEDAWTWICANPITEQEFRYLTARIEHAVKYDETDPFAVPNRPIDLLHAPILF